MTYVNRWETEKSVLNVYQKVNPSEQLIDKDENILKKFEDFIETLFRDKLKFPLKMFNEAKVLDLGSGTGESCLFYAKWGAKLTCVEMNKFAVERLNKLFLQFKLEKNIEEIKNESLFDFDPKDKKYDIVISTGVLHHTENPELGFQKQVCNLIQGGYVVVGIGNSAGGFQRNLQRLILFKFSKDNEELEKLALELFPEHVSRASKFGRRTKKQVIYDSFINPKIHWISFEEILTWFSKYNIKFYSSWPPMQFPFPLINSANTSRLNIEKENKRYVGGFSELFWMIANESDEDVILRNEEIMKNITSRIKNISHQINNITPDSINNIDIQKLIKLIDPFDNKEYVKILEREISRFSLFKKEVLDLLGLLDGDLETLKIKINSYKVLFKGICGLGSFHIVGYRPI